MTDEQFNQIALAVCQCQDSADRQAAYAAMRAVRMDANRRLRILNLVKESLSQLRLDTKYLIFDLEATRRERDAAIKKLEEQ